MRVFKRNGQEQDFDLGKIIAALTKAYNATGIDTKDSIDAVLGTVQQSLSGVSTITVEDIQEEGMLEEEESEIIQAAVDFGDYTVKDVLMPLNKMTMYNSLDYSKRDMLKFLTTVPYSRIPVYEKDKDNIIGILHVKKYLLAVKDNKKYINFKSILTKPSFVDASTKIDDMLDIFQTSHVHIAIVQNKNNKTIGMVTMEDVVEKLVGDIDEKNPPKAEIELGGDE